MKKRVKGKTLSRNKAQRKALFRALTNSLVEKGKIQTTYAKAKETKRHFEKLVTHGKKATLHNQRIIQSFLQNKDNTKKLASFSQKELKGKTGGYLKLQKIGRRRGDNAMMAELSLPLSSAKNQQPKTKSQKSSKAKTLLSDKHIEDPVGSKRYPTGGESTQSGAKNPRPKAKDQTSPSTPQPLNQPTHQQQKKV